MAEVACQSTWKRQPSSTLDVEEDVATGCRLHDADLIGECDNATHARQHDDNGKDSYSYSYDDDYQLHVVIKVAM